MGKNKERAFKKFHWILVFRLKKGEIAINIIQGQFMTFNVTRNGSPLHGDWRMGAPLCTNNRVKIIHSVCRDALNVMNWPYISLVTVQLYTLKRKKNDDEEGATLSTEKSSKVFLRLLMIYKQKVVRHSCSWYKKYFFCYLQEVFDFILELIYFSKWSNRLYIMYFSNL